MKPLARRDRLIVRELEGELLVYDLERHRAHCLNQTAAAVWRLCDGRRTLDGIGDALEEELGVEGGRDLAAHALRRLEKARLIAGPAGVRAMPRRAVLRRLATLGVLVPAVSSISAPAPAQAATCLPNGSACTRSDQCCSGCCRPAGDRARCLPGGGNCLRP